MNVRPVIGRTPSSSKTPGVTQADASDDRSLPRSDNVRRELALLLDNKKENHTILVAFAGHGVQW